MGTMNRVTKKLLIGAVWALVITTLVVVLTLFLSSEIWGAGSWSEISGDGLNVTANVTGVPSRSSIDLSWSTDDGSTYHVDSLDYDLKLTAEGDSFEVLIKIVNTEDFNIQRALLVIDGATAGQFAIESCPSEGECDSLAWSGDFEAFYHGSVDGSLMPAGYDETVHLRLTAKAAGTYFLRFYIVQLDEPTS